MPAIPNMIAFIGLSIAVVEIARSTMNLFVIAIALAALIVLGGALVRHFRQTGSSSSRDKQELVRE